MKKICYITTIPGTLRTFVLKSAIQLYETGEFDITFISNSDKIVEKDFPDFIHFIPLNMTRGVSLNAVSAIRKLIKIFRKEQFDLVQYSTPNASCYASIAAKIAKVPIRLYCQWGIVYVGFSGFKRKIFKFIEKMVCKNSTWIEPDSHGNLIFSHEEGLYPKEKGSVIWNGSASGISFDKFDIKNKDAFRKEIRDELKIGEDAYVFGFLGRLCRDKGVNELLTSIRRLVNDNKDIYLLHVGGIEKNHKLDEELISWANDSEHVIFAGKTRTPEKYYAAMDCYILPSYREGFGMTVIEASSMELPVIVTNIPGPTEGVIHEKTGIVVEKKNSVALYDAMLKLYLDKNLGKEYGKAGREFVLNNFEQKQLLNKIEEDRRRLLNF